jgi:hypothetical protein
MACLDVKGAMKLTPTPAMQVLLNLTPLNLLIMAETRMVLYRMHTLKQTTVSETEAGLISIRKNISDYVFNMRSDNTIPVYDHSRIFKVNVGWDYCSKKDPVFPKDTLVCFTDGCKADSGTGSGIYDLRPKGSLRYPLGKFTTVFRTELYDILQCACENIRRAYKTKPILIFSKSQAARKALNSPKVTS